VAPSPGVALRLALHQHPAQGRTLEVQLMFMKDEIELAKAALECCKQIEPSAKRNEAAMRLLRDECGITLLRGSQLIDLVVHEK
jgi:hypothetical protein